MIPSCGQYSGRVRPTAKHGVLDLSKWDFEKDGPVLLNGEWTFFWERLISAEGPGPMPPSDFHIQVPGFWNFQTVKGRQLPAKGFATYALEVSLPAYPNPLGLRIRTIVGAYAIWIDGRRVALSGVPAEKPENEVFQFSPGVSFFQANQYPTRIVVQISNHAYPFFGGIRDPIALGTAEQTRKLREQWIVYEALVFGGIFLLGVYHLVLFALRTKDRSTFYFACLCLLAAVHGITLGEVLIQAFGSVGIGLQMKLLNVGYIVPTVAAFYLHSLFPREVPKWFLWPVSGAGLILLVYVAAAPMEILFLSENVFRFWMIATGAFLVLCSLVAARRKRPGAMLFVGGLSAPVISIVLDNLIAFNVIATPFNFLGLGFLALMFSQSVLLARRFARAFYETENLSTSFARFVPQEFLHFLGRESILDVDLGDSVQKEMSILFSDIRGFTTISEKMSTDATFRFINRYLMQMEPPIRNNQGFIDKYIGDAVMAIFPNSPAHAVKSAIEMQKEVKGFNQTAEFHIKIGIGIHYGNMMLGAIGGELRMDGTVISDAVNLAARLEGLTKLFQAFILVSGEVLEKCDGRFLSRHLGRVQVKGKSRAVEVFEILDADPDTLREKKLATKVDFEQAIGLYQSRNFVEAGKLFAAVIAASSDDPVAALYLKRCEAFIADPPPDDWDGVEVMEGK